MKGKGVIEKVFLTLFILWELGKKLYTWWNAFNYIHYYMIIDNPVIENCPFNKNFGNLKGLSVIIYSKLHFFRKPQFFFFFLHIQRELHCNNLPISLGNSIFLERETILCCWESIIASNNVYKPVFLVRNHLNLDFLNLVYFSIWDSNTYFFKNIILEFDPN